MKKEELEEKINEIKDNADREIKAVISKYCNDNNPYKVGDVFTDHIGSIIIEKIKIDVAISHPCCVYFGLELKKDGTPRKDKSKRHAWQKNDIIKAK